MAEKSNDLIQRPLYVFDLPPELLQSIHLKDSATFQPSPSDSSTLNDRLKNSTEDREDGKLSTSCNLCRASFQTLQEQRRHMKSDWHGYNLKQKLKGLKTINEIEFDKLVDDLEESISGSDSEDSEDGHINTKEGTLTALLKKQAKLHDTTASDEDVIPEKRTRGAGKPPLVWFSTPLLSNNVSLGVYRAIFTNAEQEDSDMTNVLRNKQLSPEPSKPLLKAGNGVPLPTSVTSPHVFMCMIGGGHFAAMIVSLAPKLAKKASGVEERQAIVIAHKTFHRYTTRRKQGGAQSANDSAKGAAHSAGSSLRRYNEAALETDIRTLLAEWRSMIDKASLIFVRATGSTNRRTLFGPYEGQVLRHNDLRNRSFPFSTRRATQAELMRAFVELTRVKVSEIDEAALVAANAAEQKNKETPVKPSPVPSKLVPPKPSKEEEAALLHTSQLQALIRRSKAPAVLSYISSNSLSPDFIFYPPTSQANHHAPTPLHLAASINSSAVVLALLTKGNVNPSVTNGEGKPPFDLAGDRATRDAFRVSRSELGDTAWNWDAAHCPPPLTKIEADKREQRERTESEKAEAERRRIEMDKIKKDSSTEAEKSEGKRPGRALGAAAKTGTEQREVESRGMTPEMKARLERERRARAAEERIRRMAGGPGGGGAGR